MWPSELTIVRHGQSAGNVALDRALEARLPVVEIGPRDADVPLSALGSAQSTALGRWFAESMDAPDVVWCSPYARARDTARLLAESAGWAAPTFVDERLREREFGVLDRLTRVGIEERFPAEVAARDRLGKFYYRPPGGESWADVVLRLRSFSASLCERWAGRRVVVVTHQVSVLCLRYIIEALDETAILAIDRAGDVVNCGVTSYERAGDALQLVAYNSTAPLEAKGVPVTAPAEPHAL